MIREERRADTGPSRIAAGRVFANSCQIDPDVAFDPFSVSLAIANPSLSAGCEVSGGNLICGAVNVSGSSVPSSLTVVLY